MPSEFHEEIIELSLRDLCEARGWELMDLARRLNPPLSKSMISLLSRGLRQLAPLYAAQMAELLQKPESQIWRAIAEGKRRYELRQAYLAQSAPASKPAAKRPRTTSVA